MMDELPVEVLKTVFHFLLDDPVSICRFELTSQSNCKLVRNSPELFQEILDFRWTKGNERNNETDINPRKEFERRYEQDQIAIKCVNDMANTLRIELGEHASSMNNFPSVGKSWNNPNWTLLLLELRLDAYDILKSMANALIDYKAEVLKQNLCRFLAARTVVRIHISQCLLEWKKITSSDYGEYQATQIESEATQIEKLALLAAKAQMTPPELLDETNPMEVDVTKHLDRIADKCRTTITNTSSRSNKEKILVISEVLFGEMGFAGNNEDYYNYKNSLLNHLLKSKKGIPMTLAVLFACVARRLNIVTDIIGLPGHVVLGFFDDTTSKQLYLDVYRGGKIMQLEECQRISSSYGFAWDDNFIRPLPPLQVYTRILNNLINCHGQLPVLSAPPLFRETLAFQARQLMLAHKMPYIVERMLQDRPLTMPIDLLSLYGLLHANDGQCAWSRDTDS
mmetsp:Transcript_16563/g.24440  ORF Transcript_16563/g.24440 Transcript_16563/m.24440 type:complete len:453 (-) Transcript_16563:421-1779(-)